MRLLFSILSIPVKNQGRAVGFGGEKRRSFENVNENAMQIYGLKNCDTCRKAIKALPNAEFLDVRSDGVPEQMLKAAHLAFGEALVNTRSTTWRGLSETERKAPPLDLLQSHPNLMKRPLIRDDAGALHLGWTAATQKDLGL